ncbi:MAG: hypothetical protein AVDCRST_MAG37-2753, partial [uncultured Rubrobacteraceae bacterium]
ATRPPLPRAGFSLAPAVEGVAGQRRGGRRTRLREARRDRDQRPRASRPHKDGFSLSPARLLHPVPLGGRRRRDRADPLRRLRTPRL